MVAGLIIAVVFLMSLLLCWSLMSGMHEKFEALGVQPQRPAAPAVPQAQPGHCLLCAQTLPKAARSCDDVVAEIERRADSDTVEVVRILGSCHQEAYEQLYIN